MIKSKIIITIVIILGLISVCIWFNMPIYPDEIAFRISRTRYLEDNGYVDGSSVHGLAVFCKGGLAHTPTILKPAAILMSFIEKNINLRFISITSIIFLFLSLLSIKNINNYVKLLPILLVGFVGVAGSGIVLARFETINIILIGLSIININFKSINLVTKFLLVILNFLAITATVYIHPQGILFFPISFYSIYKMLGIEKGRNLTIQLFIYVYLIFISITFHDLTCTDFKGVKSAFDEMTFNLKNHENESLLKYLIEKKSKYIDSFIYKKEYPLYYIPGIAVESNILIKAINNLIKILWLTILLINIFGIVKVFKDIYIRINIKKELLNEDFENKIIYITILLPIIFLFFYDEPQYFYRSIFIGLIISYTTLFFLVDYLNSKNKKIFYSISFAIFFVFSLSLIINYKYFYHSLYDWKIEQSNREEGNALKYEVDYLSDVCEINKMNGAIVIDDLTYKHFSKKANVFHMWYLKYVSNITGISIEDITTQINVNAVVGKCEDMNHTGFGWPATYKKNKICCAVINK